MKPGSAFLLTLLLASCSAASGGDASGPVRYPKGAKDLVLQIGTEGGFVPVEFNLTRLPDLALYGDGRLITPGPQILIYPGPALPNLLVRRLTPEAVAAVVEEATLAGLTGPDRNFQAAENLVSDQQETVFTLVTRKGRHTSRVHGLGTAEELKGAGSEASSIRVLRDLRDRLTNLEAWLPRGSLGPEEPYTPTEMRIFSSTPPPPPPEGLHQTPVVWPLPQPLAEFGSPVRPEGYRCGTVREDDLAKLLEAADNANQLTPWESEGVRYSLLFRPLLPDESGCPEAA